MYRLAASALLTLALAGCVSSGVNVREEQTAQFTQGQTTKAEVIAALGRPTATMQQSDGTSTLVYNYVEARTRPETYIPFIGAFVGGADSRSNIVSLRFDAQDKLIDYNSAASEVGTGMGAAAGQIEPVPNQPRK